MVAQLNDSSAMARMVAGKTSHDSDESRWTKWQRFFLLLLLIMGYWGGMTQCCGNDIMKMTEEEGPWRKGARMPDQSFPSILHHTQPGKMSGSPEPTTPAATTAMNSSSVEMSGMRSPPQSAAKTSSANGSLKKFLMDSNLAPEDVRPIGIFLAKMKFFTHADLQILAMAFFESMPKDAAPIQVYKLWKVMYEESLMDGALGEPDYKVTLATLESMRHLESTGVAPMLAAARQPNVSPRHGKRNEPTRRRSMFGEAFDGEPAYERVKPAAGGSRKSGVFNPQSLTGRGDDVESNASTHEKGLWAALPTLERFDMSMADNPTAEGKQLQSKLREKMITSAVTTLPAFNDSPEDFVQWRDRAMQTFAAAGRAQVLYPNFQEWASSEGWTDQEILETDRWASVVIRSALAGCDMALDAFDQGKEGEGSMQFCYLRRHFELLGSNVREKLRREIEGFKPKSGEDPMAMIRRLNKLYLSYEKCPNPEPQSVESRTRKILNNASHFDALAIKVKMIQSDLTSGKMKMDDMTYQGVCEELISEWLSFGAADTISINRISASEVQSLRDEMELLRRDNKKLETKIKVANAAASKTLGQGKEGGTVSRWGSRRNEHGSIDDEGSIKCLIPGCGKHFTAPRRSSNPPTMCSDCWQDFHASDDETRTLTDNRVVTKTHNPKWPKSVSIEKFLCCFQRVPDDILEDQVNDHLSMVTVSLPTTASPSLDLTSYATAVKKGGVMQKNRIFILLDSGAAIGASDAPEYFHGDQEKVHIEVSGFNAKDSAMTIGIAQSGAMVLRDDRGRPFIGRYGGNLRAQQGEMNDTIWSVSQMLVSYDNSDGVVGAYMAERNASLIVAGGRAVPAMALNGLFGIYAEPIDANDTRWTELDHVWVSKEGVYVPPKSMDPKAPILKTKSYMVLSMTVDEGDQDKVQQAVQKDFRDEYAHAMKGFTYMKALDLSNALEERIFEARGGGQNMKKLQKMYELNSSGSDVLSAKGRENLKILTGTSFRHAGTNFKKHKQRIRDPSRGKLSKYTRQAGDILDTDSYPNEKGSKVTSFQVVSDPEIDVGWVYNNHLKSDLCANLKEHFSVFVLPFVVRGDFSKEMHLGQNQIMCRDQIVQLKSSTPYHQWQYGGERYMLKVTNMATYLKLDSQLPKSMTLEVLRHAALVLMVSPTEYQGLITTGYKVYFQTDYNYTLLKRLGCMVYYRLEKKDRKRFGYHGALAIHVGLNGFKFPDFTYKLYIPQTRQFIFRRDVLFAEDYMPFRESRQQLSNFKQDHWVRPGVGVLSRSVLKEATVDVSKSLDGWDDASLTMAATNLAREPMSWMNLSGCAASPIKLQDTIVVDFEDHKSQSS